MLLRVLGGALLVVAFIYWMPAPGEYRNEKPIDGAFEFSLGEEFDPSSMGRGITEEEGESSVEVDPPKPLKYFRHYSLSLTPRSHRIREIRAESETPDEESCERKFRELDAILSEKYGVPTQPYITLGKLNVYTDIHRRTRKVYLRCEPTLGTVRLSILYVDRSLEKRFREETVEKLSTEIDESAL